MSQVNVNTIGPRTSANVNFTGLNPPSYLGSELAQTSLSVQKAGGTMSGPLVLSGDASAALNPISKQQFDAGFTSSLTTNGHQKLPSGLIIQWGVLTTTGGIGNTETITFSFPTPFLNALFSITANAEEPADSGWNPTVIRFDTRTLTGARAVLDTANSGITFNGSVHVHWMALGY